MQWLSFFNNMCVTIKFRINKPFKTNELSFYFLLRKASRISLLQSNLVFLWSVRIVKSASAKNFVIIRIFYPFFFYKQIVKPIESLRSCAITYSKTAFVVSNSRNNNVMNIRSEERRV